MSGQKSGVLYRSEFLDRELFDFTECQEHYRAMSPWQLFGELGFLFRQDIMEIPFRFTGKRYYAFLSALIECASSARDFSDRKRAELVNTIIDVRDYATNRTEESSRVALDAAVTAQLDGVATYALFPKVAELIREGTRYYNGTFPESIIGQSQSSDNSRVQLTFY